MASNISIKFDGFTGNSTATASKEEIELMSFHHGLSLPVAFNEASNDTRSVGNVRHQDMKIVKVADKATPQLCAACCSGKILAKATLTVRKTKDNATTKVFTYELEKVIVSSVSYQANTDGEITETVMLNYAAITWNQGAVNNSAGWSLEKNEKTK
jgi:type VI secretion system secreted protein Hcp